MSRHSSPYVSPCWKGSRLRLWAFFATLSIPRIKSFGERGRGPGGGGKRPFLKGPFPLPRKRYPPLSSRQPPSLPSNAFPPGGERTGVPAGFAAFRARYLRGPRRRAFRFLAISSHCPPSSPASCFYSVQKQTESQDESSTKVKSGRKEILKRRRRSAGLDTKAQRTKDSPAPEGPQGRESAGPKPRVACPGSCLFRSHHPEKNWAQKKPRAERRALVLLLKEDRRGEGDAFRHAPGLGRPFRGRRGGGRTAGRALSEGREKGSKRARLLPQNITFRSRRSRPTPRGPRCSAPSRPGSRRAGCTPRAGSRPRCPSSR